MLKVHQSNRQCTEFSYLASIDFLRGSSLFFVRYELKIEETTEGSKKIDSFSVYGIWMFKKY